MTKQQLVLEDGTTFIGTGFGSTESISGEVVFLQWDNWIPRNDFRSSKCR